MYLVFYNKNSALNNFVRKIELKTLSHKFKIKWYENKIMYPWLCFFYFTYFDMFRLWRIAFSVTVFYVWMFVR